jgi:hypothetical protein
MHSPVLERNISTKSPKSLCDLPQELLVLIVGQLDPITSTCLSILCKRLHKAHKDTHGKLLLDTPTGVPYQLLGHLLSAWAATSPKALVYDSWISPYFVTKERLIQLEQENKEKERKRDEAQRLRYRYEKIHGREALTDEVKSQLKAKAERN